MKTKSASPSKTWEKTRLQGLVRHKSGGYYARFFLKGKEVWKSLRTKHFSVAEARLAEAQKEHKQRKSREANTSSVRMTFGTALELSLQRLRSKVTLKKNTLSYYAMVQGVILRSWPELAEKEVRRITENAWREWAANYAKRYCATLYNCSVSLVKNAVAVAVESGVVFSNTAACLERKGIKPKKLELPTLEQFAAFIAAIRSAPVAFAEDCADLAQGLAYTGCRIKEAEALTWQDMDFTKGEIRVAGDPIEGTKNGEVRYVPMTPESRAFFARMREKRAKEPFGQSVFKVKGCERSMTAAAKKVGMTRITHHSLRHFFATICIESGVDVPTVSRWLGHKDGGILAMKTYGHLRREHSLSQAKKVSFAPKRE